MRSDVLAGVIAGSAVSLILLAPPHAKFCLHIWWSWRVRFNTCCIPHIFSSASTWIPSHRRCDHPDVEWRPRRLLRIRKAPRLPEAPADKVRPPIRRPSIRRRPIRRPPIRHPPIRRPPIRHPPIRRPPVRRPPIRRPLKAPTEGCRAPAPPKALSPAEPRVISPSPTRQLTSPSNSKRYNFYSAPPPLTRSLWARQKKTNHTARKHDFNRNVTCHGLSFSMRVQCGRKIDPNSTASPFRILHHKQRHTVKKVVLFGV